MTSVSSSTNGLILVALLLAACGSKSDGGAGAGTPDSGPADWGTPIPNGTFPFDPNAGCRSFDRPACDHCCRQGVSSGGLACSQFTELSASASDGPCPSDCQPCAPCMQQTEDAVFAVARQPRPDCDCDGLPPQLDPCSVRDGCGCFCTGLQFELSSCPQFADFACIGTGNRCGVLLLVGNGPYSAGDLVAVIWMNATSEPMYLSGCVDLVGYDPDKGVQRATFCPNAPPMLKVGPGQHITGKTLSITGSTTIGSVHLESRYYRGCQERVPLGPAGCATGPLYIQSNEFDVYATH